MNRADAPSLRAALLWVITIILLALNLYSCSPVKQASYKDRRGLMLLEPGEYQRNRTKSFHQSNTVRKIQKKNKSLLKRTYRK
jgi:hypothetical protein